MQTDDHKPDPSHDNGEFPRPTAPRPSVIGVDGGALDDGVAIVTAPKWAHRDDVKEGDTLIADGGFTCIGHGTELAVLFDEDTARGGLFVECADGKHFLAGQLDEGHVYIGFTLVEPSK